MKIKNKTYYYFEKKDKDYFTDFLWESHNKMTDFAELCGISQALLSLIVNGKRPISKEMIKKFKKNGFEIKFGE